MGKPTMRPRVPDHVRKAIVEAYKSHRRLKEIAYEFGVSHGFVCNLAREAGATNRWKVKRERTDGGQREVAGDVPDGQHAG